jgi:hypothetical protein
VLRHTLTLAIPDWDERHQQDIRAIEGPIRSGVAKAFGGG